MKQFILTSATVLASIASSSAAVIQFDLGQLNELTIQKLDLRNCAKFNLETSLSLPALETIIIDPKIHKAENIKDRVWSSVNFEIIEAH